MSRRILAINVRGLGVGPAPGSLTIGDAGANSLASICKHALAEKSSPRPLHLKTLSRLGLGEIVADAGGISVPTALQHSGALTAAFGFVDPGRNDDNHLSCFETLDLNRHRITDLNDHNFGALTKALINGPQPNGGWIDLSCTGSLSDWSTLLQRLDQELEELDRHLTPEDLLMIVSDQGCDPAWRDGRTTHEFLPFIVSGAPIQPGPLDGMSGYQLLSNSLLSWQRGQSFELSSPLYTQLFRLVA